MAEQIIALVQNFIVAWRAKLNSFLWNFKEIKK
jgi:hypothetical protein